MPESTESFDRESSAETSGDELAAWVAKVQTAAENGESRDRARLRIIGDGAEAEVADEIVSRVYDDENRQLPLSRRHRAAAAASAAESTGYGWMIWIGVLLFVNLLSWVFDWPFWIY